jgi:hypothetical protein
MINEALNSIGGQCLAAAGGNVQVDDDRTEGEDFGEEQLVDAVLCVCGEQVLARPFSDPTAPGEGLEPFVFLRRQLGAETSRTGHAHGKLLPVDLHAQRQRA